MFFDAKVLLAIFVIVNPLLTTSQYRPEMQASYLSSGVQFISYAGGHRKLMVRSLSVRNREELRFLDHEGSADRVLATLTSDPGEGFESPVHFESGGEDFVYVSTIPVGSGGFVTETIYWVAPDGTLHQIPFSDAASKLEHELSPGETLLTGGPGILFTEDGLSFEYLIARDEDPHCCPTGGMITGSYRVIGEKQYDRETGEFDCTFQIVPESFVRRDSPM